MDMPYYVQYNDYGKRRMTFEAFKKREGREQDNAR